MRNFDTVVCAVDLHPAADRALPHVAALARARVAVELVTVIDDNVPTAWATVELERRAEQYGLTRHELFVIHARSPGRAIVDHVTGRDGALLVIATTAHGGRDEHQLGAVTDDVLRGMQQPVMVVGPRAERSAGGLVVVVDEDGSADPAMPIVERWSSTFGHRPLEVVEVQAPDAWPDQVDREPAPCVDRYVELLGGRGIVATGQVLRGLEPVVSIIDHLERADAAIVVVSSPSDIGQPTHWFHTARRLIRFSPRPVLVVRAGWPLGRPGRASER